MRRLAICSAILGALLLAPSAVLAVPIAISGSAGTDGLGSFTGTFDYIPIDDFSGTLIVALTNTSPAANGGFITAFVFNIPDGVDVGAGTTLAPSSASLRCSSADPPATDSFNNSVTGVSLWRLRHRCGSRRQLAEVAAARPTGSPWEAPEPSSSTWRAPGSTPARAGRFPEHALERCQRRMGEQAFVVRFRGFEDGGSDKVPMDTLGEPIPEPGTMILLSLGLASLSARRLHSRKP